MIEQMNEHDLDTLEGEIREVDFVITLAEQDKKVQNYLLGEVVRKFEIDGLKERQETIIYEDKVAEVLELTRHDTGRINKFILKLLQTEEIEQVLWENYIDQMGSKGLLIRAERIIEEYEKQQKRKKQEQIQAFQKDYNREYRHAIITTVNSINNRS